MGVGVGMGMGMGNMTPPPALEFFHNFFCTTHRHEILWLLCFIVETFLNKFLRS